MYPHSSTKTECRTTPRFINQLAYAVLFSSTSGLFRSDGRGRASLTRKSMPSRVLTTVRSCMNSLSGSRLRSSLFICHKESRQFSLIISRRQFHISSSTRTLFRPPRGLSWMLPSRMYLLTPFAVHYQKIYFHLY